MVEDQLKVAIYGSCVSRDSLEASPRVESIGYIARQSMISAVAIPAPPTQVQLGSPWQKLMVQSDLSSLGLRDLLAVGTRADVILIDLVDERLGIRVWPDGAVATDSAELRQAVPSEYLEATMTLGFGSDEHYLMWEKAAEEFISGLRLNGIEDRVLVIDAIFAERDHEGHPVPGFMGLPADHWNASYRRYIDVFDNAGFEIHRMPVDVRADAGHRWGAAGYHYVPQVYEQIVNHFVDVAERAREIGRSQDRTSSLEGKVVSRSGREDENEGNAQTRSRAGSQDSVKELSLDVIMGGGHALIGKPGFTPPVLDKLRWREITPDVQIDNVVVRCPPGAVNNWMLVADDWAPPHRTVLTLGTQARENVIIIDSNCRVYGNITLNGSGGLLAYSECARQPSSVNVALFGRDEIFFWGKDSTSNGVSFDSVNDFGGIIIGDDCMFARGIWARTSDQHAVFDIESMELLNPSGDVVLEPHVFVGQDAAIMKNSHIGMGSIVAARALVNKSFPAYSVIAGMPGKVVRSGATWDRSLQPKAETRDRLKQIEEFWNSQGDGRL